MGWQLSWQANYNPFYSSDFVVDFQLTDDGRLGDAPTLRDWAILVVPLQSM